MFKVGQKVIYSKVSSNHGVGDVVLGSSAIVLKISNDKCLVEFESGKKALIPFSYLKIKN